jgi:hypothetical protein
VERELRKRETCVRAARSAEDLVPQPVGVEQLLGPDPHIVQRVEQPESGELLDRVRQRVDPHAQLADLLALLVNDAVDAVVVQPQSGGEAPDSRSHDDDPHGGPPVRPRPQDGADLRIAPNVGTGCRRCAGLTREDVPPERGSFG